MIWALLNIIAALITMPIFVKPADFKWKVCLLYFGLCLVFTPFVGIPLYKFAGG